MELVYSEECETFAHARKREVQVKHWSRAKKEVEDFLRTVREFKIEVEKWLQKKHPEILYPESTTDK